MEWSLVVRLAAALILAWSRAISEAVISPGEIYRGMVGQNPDLGTLLWNMTLGASEFSLGANLYSARPTSLFCPVKLHLEKIFRTS